MDLDQIKKVLDSGSGKSLKSYLMIKLDELKSIDNVSEKETAITQALEIKAQKRAYLKLKEILQDLMTFSEDVKVKDPRDSFAITDEDIQ